MHNTIKKRANIKRATSIISAGGAIVIVIFVVLCLTIFGLLSFTTAFADKRLADKSLSYVEIYYNADAKAESKLAEVYNALYGTDELVFPDGVSGIVNASNSDGGVTVAYSIPINDLQNLDCVVEYYIDRQLNTLRYKVQKWQVVITDALEYENGYFDLWEGEFDF